ncbi:MAG: DUF72 domain-containing protein [Planctomycetota bacterium]
MGTLLCGTSSWSEKSWVGSFYPDQTQPRDFLGYYATQFPAVEADVTYYRIPSRSMVQGWRDRTPDDFRLCAKFPRSIVFGGDGPKPEGEKVLVPAHVQGDTEMFLDHMSGLGEKCGPLVMQFPYFNKQAFESPAPFLDRLHAYLESLPRDFRYAVEVRNKWWVNDKLLDVLRQFDVAFVLVELGYLPHPADVAGKRNVVTSDFIYARLIGDRKAVDEKTKTFDKLVLDKGDSLDRWADLLQGLLEEVPAAYVFANNHFAGHGPATVRDLVSRVDDRSV